MYEDAHEFTKPSGKAKEGWKENSYMLLLGEKEEDDLGKKQVNYT